ncbi:MAG: hypothetical protein ACN6P8_24690, partial [Achromobacter piechaudii]
SEGVCWLPRMALQVGAYPRNFAISVAVLGRGRDVADFRSIALSLRRKSLECDRRYPRLSNLGGHQ